MTLQRARQNMARAIVQRSKIPRTLRPLLRLVPSRSTRQAPRDYLRYAILYWLIAGIGIGFAVFVMAQAAVAETIKLPGVNGVVTPVALVTVTGSQAGEYVDAREIGRILRGTYRYDAGSKIFTLEAQGRKVSFLIGSERFLVTKQGTSSSASQRERSPSPSSSGITGRLPVPPIRHRSRSLFSRASSISFLKQFHKITAKSIDAALMERLPIPITPDPRASSPVPAPSTTSMPVTRSNPAIVDTGRVASFIRSIVIDAGHGDHDPGAIGPGGTKEKEINLDVAVKLAELLGQRSSGLVRLTRDTDTFLSLKERVDFAKRHKADLFISIHTNSSGSRNRHLATGSEVYFFSTPSDEDARRAERLEGGPFDPQAEGIDPVLWDLMLAGNVVESHKLAEAVASKLPRALGLPNRGVRSARFYVMYYGVMSNIPSILVELGFVSNPDEERKLADPEWRTKAAEAISGATVEYLKDLERRYPGGRGWVR